MYVTFDLDTISNLTKTIFRVGFEKWGGGGAQYNGFLLTNNFQYLKIYFVAYPNIFLCGGGGLGGGGNTFC